MKKCPHCAEEIQDEAVICRFCQRAVAPAAPPPKTSQYKAQTKQSNKKALVIVGSVLVFAFIVAALVQQPAPAQRTAPVKTGPTIDEQAANFRHQLFNAVQIEKDLATVAKRYGRSVEELKVIEAEGARKGWKTTDKLLAQNEPPASPSGPFLKVIVTKAEYDHGYFKTVGTVENTGTAPAFSPQIVLRITAPDGTLLATDNAYPTGAMFANMPPGQKSAFTHIVSVPGEPRDIRYGVSVPKYPADITLPK